MAFRFDDAGRMSDATRLSRIAALLGEPANPSEVPAGSRLLIDVAAEARTIDAKLRQHRADHGVVRRGPKTCRKSA